MKAEPFRADETFPPIVTQADDGTPLRDDRGWSCAECGTLYADRGRAEECCESVEPDAVAVAESG